jgi:hypothetical protein
MKHYTLNDLTKTVMLNKKIILITGDISKIDKKILEKVFGWQLEYRPEKDFCFRKLLDFTKFVFKQCKYFRVGSAIITESPWIISDFKSNDVFIVRKKGKKIWLTNPSFQTFGSSTNYITMKLLNRPITIGNVSYKELKKEMTRKNKIYDHDDIDKINSDFGSSLEKDIYLRTLRRC